MNYKIVKLLSQIIHKQYSSGDFNKKYAEKVKNYCGLSIEADYKDHQYYGIKEFNKLTRYQFIKGA
jgi:hypothetical protein